MLILGEGDVEWHNEDQVTLSMPADPNCPEPTQPGKTWITQKAYGLSSVRLLGTPLLLMKNRGPKGPSGARWRRGARAAAD